jgi:HlyD family secretion protein
VATAIGEDLPLADPGIATKATRRSRGGLRLALIAIVGAGLFGAGWGLAPRVEQHRASEEREQPSSVATPSRVVALGRLQPRGGVVDVAAPTSSASPRVLEVLVHEDEHVVAGQPLVVLDTCPQLVATEQSAMRGVEIARAALEQTRRDVASGRKESKAAAAAARVSADLAARERERQTGLFDAGAVASADFDQANSAAEQSAAELRRARVAVERYSDPADVRLAEANLAAAEADLERTRVDVQACTVRAPSDGVILSLYVQPGERAPSGSLLRLADIARMEAEIEVFQESIVHIATGDSFRLESELLPDAPLRGRVEWIGREVGRQSLTSNDPAANTDARVVKVRIALDAASIPVAARLVGLEVIAYLDAEDPA